jgi:demethylmenaquinone methyltransferase/2-methoxy-6-polyprenyl-1,4-benzoquinol methylase
MSKTKAYFSSIHRHYDLTNHLLSLGLHRIWNKTLIQSVSGKNLLDLCAGTGAIARLALQNGFDQVVLVDFCAQMLDIAKLKIKSNAQFIEADVEQVPLTFQFDAATMAYGIRNVENKHKALQEAHRLLKKGGKIGILELTTPKNKWVRQLHKFYLKCYLPLIGFLFTKNKKAYSYLATSILSFDLKDIISLLENAGFKNIEIRQKTLGLATIVTAQKI